jgi:NADPH:quinone reductase-like Zn-dependent oxidoreductase
MKAIRLLEYGGQLVFNDVPKPTIASDEILVKVRSTAVNHLDLVEASGTVRQILPIDLPWIPGHEFSGVVEQIGSGVAAWAQGEAVFGTIRPHVATVYALEDAAQAWNDIARNLPEVHGMSPSGPGVARRKSHGKIVLRVA